MNTDKNVVYCHPANTEAIHLLDADEVLENNEICCPPFDGCLWSSHPRVFLKLNENGQTRCPYCSTLYVLHPGTVAEHQASNPDLQIPDRG